MKTRLKFLVYIFVLLILYSFYYWMIPYFANKGANSKFIQNRISKELGIDFKVQDLNFKMGLNPSVWVMADEFKIVDKGSATPLYLKNPKLKINLIPLLAGKFNLAYFSCDKFSGDFKLDKQARFYVGNHLILNSSNSKFSIQNSKMNLNDITFKIKDELQNKIVFVNCDYFNLKKFNSKRRINLDVSANLKSGAKVAVINANIDCKLPIKKSFNTDDIVIDASITNLDLSNLSQYIRKLTNGKITKTQGIINFEAKTKKINSSKKRVETILTLQDLYVRGESDLSSVFYHGKLNLLASGDFSKNKLVVNDFKILSKDINILVSGAIYKLASKSPDLDLKVEVSNTKSSEMLNLVSVVNEVCNDVHLANLKKHGFYSDINAKLSIQGKFPTPQVYGDIVASNAYVIKEPPFGIPKANVKLSFTGKNVDMDVNVPTGNSGFVRVKGPINLYGEKIPKLEVSSSKNVNLEFARSVLVPVHEIFCFDLGPLPVMNIDGLGDIALKISGTKKDPHLVGEFNFKDVTASFDGLSFLLTNAKGKLKFEDRNTKLTTENVLVGAKPISISGDCSLKGDLDYKISAKDQNLNTLIDILKGSDKLAEFKEMLSQIDRGYGSADFDIALNGTARTIDEFVFGKAIKVRGDIKLNNASVFLTNIKNPVTSILGNIGFENNNSDMNLSAMLNNSKISLKGTMKNDFTDILVSSNNLYLEDLFYYLPGSASDLQKAKNFSSANLSLSANYNGPIKNPDFSKLSLSAKFNHNSKVAPLKVDSGVIELKNSIMRFSDVKGSFKNNYFRTAGKIKNIFQKNQVIDASFIADKFDISTIKNVQDLVFLPEDVKKYIAFFSAMSGKVNINASIKNNILYSKLKLNDLAMIYTKEKLALKVFSGSLEINDGKLTLYKINALIDSMPILVDGFITNIFKEPNFNLYVNSKPTQSFIDAHINTKTIYPLKIRGDIIYTSRLNGILKNFNTRTEINIEKDSSIYYMGAILGSEVNPIRIFLDMNIVGKIFGVNNFEYVSLVSSQNNKEFISPQLSAKGIIDVSNSIPFFKNFLVKTQNPTDAKLFNLIFKKPLIKQGQFSSNLLINESLSKPKILGTVSFTGIDIPVFDTTIKDISLDFRRKNIVIKSTGEIFANKLELESIMLNNLTPPFVFSNIDVYYKNLDINAIMRTLKSLQAEDNLRNIKEDKKAFDIKSVIINNAEIKADKVRIKNVQAQDFSAKVKMDEKGILSAENFQFDLANGRVNGSYDYNLSNAKTNLDLHVDGINANIVSEALFDVSNQLYGSLTGRATLSCDGKTHKSCMETVDGDVGFRVVNGRMPKLGSLEYLLKAANLVKSGVTGLSLNSLIDLVTPLKTGQFDTINGDFLVNSGIAKGIRIFSKGKDLSLLITGRYNLSTQIADMTVFGRISKKVTNVLGPVGNASLNTLFNTIPGLDLDENDKAQIIKEINKVPGLELNEKLYRVFSAKIHGNINGDDYVQSFKWVE